MQNKKFIKNCTFVAQKNATNRKKGGISGGGLVKRKDLSAKEALFCEYMKILHSPREAAARAGYPFPERSAIKLLKKAAVKRALSAEAAAVDGLRRIAFGGVADAVWLCQRGEIPTREELEKLDLFMISELKFQKGGGVEVKFFDRIKALDLLGAQTVSHGGKAEPFFRALGQGAARLSFETGEEDGI
ncbi:MAG: terminase small subunit [Clostridia bacterium]|nr:terminase small subunit [Clostridia bacterium]